ncbi:MAG TPA: alpha-glucosidase [Candidatus Limnocylindrales bacterium]
MTTLPDAARSVPPHDPGWWQTGVVYQIYPRSFGDSTGDGVGDLPGIIEHLDHLAGPTGLDVDAIWLSPIYPSPGLDGGYDVADHAAIDPLFGAMADFERLVAEAHARGLRVVLDLVLNHTSDRHPWFVASRAGRTGPQADWYIWRDAAGRDRRGRPLPPNNWLSFFGGSAWAWDAGRGQFYLHTFLPEQPDLNWREPAVREAQFAMVRGWLARGVDGFRLDVFNALLKSPTLASNPQSGRLARRPWDRQVHVNDKDQAELVPLLDAFRAILDESPGRMSVGELFSGDVRQAAALARPGHLVFDFELLDQPWSAAAFRRAIHARLEAFGDGWPTVVLSNHDQSRHVSRFLDDLGKRDPATQDRVAKAAAVLLLTLRGTPFLYYGEEIGLPDVAVPRDRIKDPPARRASWRFPWWNRDQCRSPMPWSDGPGAGFTSGEPWLPLIPDWRRRNVAAEAAAGTSVLAAYRELLGLRRRSAALHRGSLELLPPQDADVLDYVREAGGERAFVAINFRDESRAIRLPPGSWSLAFTTDPARRGGQSGDVLSPNLRLGPLEAIVATATGPTGAATARGSGAEAAIANE